MLTTAAAQQAMARQVVIQAWLNDARRTGKKDVYSGKRSSPRFIWEAPITVEILDGDSAGESFFATSRDIGAGGVGFRGRHRLEQDTLVRVTLDNTGASVEAMVRHTSETLGAFIIGVEFAQE